MFKSEKTNKLIIGSMTTTDASPKNTQIMKKYLNRKYTPYSKNFLNKKEMQSHAHWNKKGKHYIHLLVVERQYAENTTFRRALKELVLFLLWKFTHDINLWKKVSQFITKLHGFLPQSLVWGTMSSCACSISLLYLRGLPVLPDAYFIFSYIQDIM